MSRLLEGLTPHGFEYIINIAKTAYSSSYSKKLQCFRVKTFRNATTFPFPKVMKWTLREWRGLIGPWEILLYN